MSIEAMIWVRKHAPTINVTEMCILYSLADRANDDGTGCWPFYETIADESRCSVQTVKRHIKKLEERGLVVRGNQNLANSYPKYRRPVVWNLNMSLRREPKKVEEKAGYQSDTPPERGINGDKVRYQPEQSEVSNETKRGITVELHNHPLTTQEPSNNPPTPAGASDAIASGLPQSDQQSDSCQQTEVATGNDQGKGRSKDFKAFLDAYKSITDLDKQMIGEAARVWHSMFKDGSLPEQETLLEGLRTYWRACRHNQRVTGRSVRKRPGNWLRDQMWAAVEENLKFQDAGSVSAARFVSDDQMLASWGVTTSEPQRSLGSDGVVDGEIVEERAQINA